MDLNWNPVAALPIPLSRDFGSFLDKIRLLNKSPESLGLVAPLLIALRSGELFSDFSILLN
jgi:hypothetical protein